MLSAFQDTPRLLERAGCSCGLWASSNRIHCYGSSQCTCATLGSRRCQRGTRLRVGLLTSPRRSAQFGFRWSARAA